MKLQNYKDGEIHRVGNKYQFVKDGKVKGTYDSVDKLVKGQSRKVGKLSADVAVDESGESKLDNLREES